MIYRLILVIRHAAAMYRNLIRPRNLSKGGWHGSDIHELRRMMRREVEEFDAALWAHETDKGSWQDVVSEGADVSNFVAMISDRAKMYSMGTVNDD